MPLPCCATSKATKIVQNTFQELDFEVDPADYRPGVLKVLATIRPKWNPKDIQAMEMERGLINFLVKCSATIGDMEDENKEKVIIRVFGTMLLHRESEVYLTRLLGEKNLKVPVYCRFNNGMAYQYAPGNCLTREQLKDDEILKLIAEKVHSVHQVDVADYIAQSGRPPLRASFQILFNQIRIPDFKDDEEKRDRYNQNLPSREQFDKDVKEWNEIYDDLEKRSPSVFGHFDLQAANVIYYKEKGTVNLIDWECCNIGPEILQVASLVCRDHKFTGVCTDSASTNRWLKICLSTHPVLSKEHTSGILQKWYRDSIQASVWLSFCVVPYFIHKIGESDEKEQMVFFGLAIKAYERYMAYKRELELLDAVKQS